MIRVNPMKMNKLFKTTLSLVLVLSMLAMFAGCVEQTGDNPPVQDPDDALQNVVSDGVDTWVDKLSSAFENAGKKEPPKIEDSKVSVTVTVGDTLIDMLEQSFAQSADQEMDFSFLSKINFDMEMDTTGDMDKMQMLIGLNGQQVITLNVLMNMAEYLIYAGSPELDDTYIKFDGSEMMGGAALPVNPSEMMGGMDVSALIDALPDKDTLSTILNRYGDILITGIKDVEYSTTTLEVNGISEECGQFLLKIYEEDALEIFKNILNTAKTDAELKTVIEEMAAAIEEMSGQDMGAEDAYTTFQEGIDSALAELDDIEEIDTENPLKIYTYVNKAGELTGVKILEPETDRCGFYFYQVTDGTTSAFVFAVPSEVSDDDQVKLSGTMSETNGKTNGTFTFAMEGVDFVTVTLKDMDDNGGTIILKPTEDLLDTMGVALPFSDLSLELKMTAEVIELNILTGSDLLVGIATRTEPSDGLDLEIPSDTVDAMDSEAMKDWASNLVLDTVFENLRNAGAGEFIDLIEELMNQEVQPEPFIA